jgi:hypothetical protein
MQALEAMVQALHPGEKRTNTEQEAAPKSR